MGKMWTAGAVLLGWSILSLNPVEAAVSKTPTRQKIHSRKHVKHKYKRAAKAVAQLPKPSYTVRPAAQNAKTTPESRPAYASTPRRSAEALALDALEAMPVPEAQPVRRAPAAAPPK